MLSIFIFGKFSFSIYNPVFQSSNFSFMMSLNGLFTWLSRNCINGVIPPSIIFILLFTLVNSSSTSSPRWLLEESINKMDFPALKNPPGLLFQIRFTLVSLIMERFTVTPPPLLWAKGCHSHRVPGGAFTIFPNINNGRSRKELKSFYHFLFSLLLLLKQWWNEAASQLWS